MMIVLGNREDVSTFSNLVPASADGQNGVAPINDLFAARANEQAPLTPEERANLLEALDHRFQPQQLRKARFTTRLSLFARRCTMYVQTRTKRCFDASMAFALLLLLSPLMICLLLANRLRHTTKLGLLCEPYTEYSFAMPANGLGRLLRMLGVERLPALYNILKGEMSFVGPRSATDEELTPRERAVRKRSEVLPGLTCLYWIRRRSNINYQTELDTDSEYVETNSLGSDLGIIVRGLPTLLYGDQCTNTARSNTILDIPIDNVTMDEVLVELEERLNGPSPSHICFVNADCVNITFRDRDYLKAVQSADLVLSDGIGMKLAGKILKQEVRQNVNGTDLFPRMCAALQGTGKGIYLFGARPGVAEGVRAWVEANYPGVVVSGTRSGFFTDEEEGAIVQDIAASGASVLLVAMGAQRQDKWIHEHLQECGASVAIGVGGLFDFFSGQTNRAPQWVREMGFEWFYRVVQEPGRLWKRYFVGNGVFLFRVFRARLIGNGKASKGRNQQGA